jgi:hypothetical protein
LLYRKSDFIFATANSTENHCIHYNFEGMKRKLEAELISIAHRILKLKNKSELAQLQQETLKLYEKISVLRFVEEHFSEAKPTIGYASAEKEVEAVYEAGENVATDALVENEAKEIKSEVIENTSDDPLIENELAEIEKEVIATDFSVEDIVAELASEIEDETEVGHSDHEEEFVDVAMEVKEEIIEEVEITEEEQELEFAPLFEIAKEEVPEIILPKQITLEDFLSEGHVEPIFVRAEQFFSNETTMTQTNPKDEKETVVKVEVFETKKMQFVIDHHEPKSRSLNDSLSKSINIGLNDRIGFEKHLFGGSSEDLNRVLSQLSTYANFQEANDFIEDMVKPDYNEWSGKEEYAARFMEIVEKKFS